MSLIEADRTPVDITLPDQGRPLISDELLAQADGDPQLANRLMFLAGLEIDLLTDPDNHDRQVMYGMAQKDLEYYLVAKGIGRAAYL